MTGRQKITSLKNIHKLIHEVHGTFYFDTYNVRSHVLGLLKMKYLKEVDCNKNALSNILNKYLPEGDLFDCQNELSDAGFEEYAQL